MAVEETIVEVGGEGEDGGGDECRVEEHSL